MTEPAVVDGYDLVIFDLDGVLILGEEPILGAPDAVAAVRHRGIAAAYATNNASRRGADVAALLTRVGIPATAPEVTTSAQATAMVLAQRVPAGSRILTVGAPALAEEVAAVGLQPVDSAADEPVAAVQGYGPEVGWAALAEACVAIRAGATWVATNTDRTLPSPRGPLPGNGSLVAALATALDRQPDLVVGKPAPTLFEQAAKAHEARRPLVVGDRLDTDIAAANRAGMDNLLVLTGVSGPADVLSAPPALRPTYVAADLGGLFARPDDVRIPQKETGWRVRLDGAVLRLSGAGDPVEALRACGAAVWEAGRDTTPALVADSTEATDALRALGLLRDGTTR